ncbi:MAG TPA: hypothetical protein EYQ31_00040 [Candidatus Handelsmanbacteria bacterium]|nr:hypothetical protein [Candidatus Handelsmanbacteria bacterium]
MTDAAGLTAELREQVLVHLGDRLSQGEVLVSGKQFVNAAEEGFLALTGEPVGDQVRTQLGGTCGSCQRGGSYAAAGA